MKAVVILVVLIATVYCLPMKRSASSSESSEERVVAQRPAPVVRKAAAKMIQAEPTQAPSVESNESTDSADDTEDADDESGTDEKEENNETNSSESESEETVATSAPTTEEPTLNPIINTGRGDSMGYPSDYKKSIVYVDAKDFEKIPSSYKSYSSEKMGGLTMVNKKMFAYDGQNINDVEKEIKLHKALQVHEEDTSTPEMEAAPEEHEVAPVGNQDSKGASAGDSPSTSSSASQEETEADSSPSSEETTATPGAADSEGDSSQSTESQESDEDTTQTTEGPVVIAK